MTHLRLGHCLDKVIDMGAIVDPSQKKAIEAFVEEARKEGAEVYQSCACMPSNGSYYPPALITNVQPVSKIVMEEVQQREKQLLYNFECDIFCTCKNKFNFSSVLNRYLARC